MVRIAEEADVPALLEVYGPYVRDTTASFEYEVPAEEEFLARFRRLTQQCPWLVWEEEGKVLGYAYGSLPFDRAAYGWCAEASIYLAPEARGRGVGKRLYEELELLLTRQGFRKVYGVITAENEASLRFHGKMGYRRVAEFPECGLKFGRWLGVVWMEKVLNSVDITSSRPIMWKDIVEYNRNIIELLDKMTLS